MTEVLKPEGEAAGKQQQLYTGMLFSAQILDRPSLGMPVENGAGKKIFCSSGTQPHSLS